MGIAPGNEVVLPLRSTSPLPAAAGYHRVVNGLSMNSTALEKLRSEALRLPEAERAELAHELVVSLDGGVDSDAEEAWDAEVVRRLAEIDSGSAGLVDREAFRQRMRTRIKG